MINGILIVAHGADSNPTEKCTFDNETNQFVCTDIEPVLTLGNNYGDGEQAVSFVFPHDYCLAPKDF